MLKNPEDKELMHRFLDRTFFKSWRNNISDANYGKLELIVTADCVLKCDYCYYKDFGDTTYPKEFRKRDTILKNLDLVLAWLEEKQMFPVFDIFSGDFFNLTYAFDFLDKIIEFQIRNGIKNDIVIPTGMSFIGDLKIENKVMETIDRCKKHGIHMFLSASVDGKYCDENRPFRSGKVRDDEWYTRCFEFCKKANAAFHPMIYFNHIEKWKDNWLWFQDMFEKYNMPWNNLYLLEVRNEGWTQEKIKEFTKFWEFVIEDIFNRSGLNAHDFFYALTDTNKLPVANTLSFLFKCGRGMPCSIQSDLSIRLGDLKIVPCHRTAYDQFNYGYMKVENDEIVDIEPLNVAMLLSVQSMNVSNSPKCETCFIRSLCAGGCLGSQYEITGDLFIPINSVCALEHAKIISSIRALKKIGVLDLILSNKGLFDNNKYNVIKYLNDKYFKEEICNVK